MITKKRHAIVLTGGPASGKTDIYQLLKNDKTLSNFIFLEELARKLLIENPSYREHWHQFHLDIYHTQVKREVDLGSKSFITDRGTADTFAFHPETAKAVNSSTAAEYSRYTTIIHLGTSASLGEKFYQTDIVRNESINEALRIEAAIGNIWNNHPGYSFYKAETDANKKRRKVISFVKSLIDE